MGRGSKVMPLINCPDCGKDISPSAPSCPHCGRPQSLAAAAVEEPAPESAIPSSAEVRSKTVRNIVIGVVVFVAFMIFVRHRDDSVPSLASQILGEPATPMVAPAPETVPVQLPSDEEALVRIIAGAQQEAGAAENDMQKGGVKHKRDADICALMQRLSVNDWAGTLQKISANSDGRGVVRIALARDITVETWNNDFSDMSDHTLIEPGSALFQAASSMRAGDTVRFSGRFFSGSGGECVKEKSMTLSGKLRDPEFIFQFSSIEPSH